MTWPDAKRILASEDFRDESELMKDLPTVEERVVQQLKNAIVGVNDIFENATKMDACVRILQVLIVVFSTIPEDKRKKVMIHCQPSVDGHTAVTDFLIVIKEDEKPKLLIEAEKASINTDLRLRSDQTAQVIRELHIIAGHDPLPFILTNAMLWSFGLGMKVGTKVLIKSRYTLALTFPAPYELLAQLLMKYLS